MKKRIERIARTGYAAKGVVYCLTGGLTFLAAFNLGGQKAGQLQVLEFLENKPFGNILLFLVGLGIGCYAIWRFTQAFSDPEYIGSDVKGKFKRFAFFLSGCSYLLLGYLAILKLLGSGGSGQGAKNSSWLMSDVGLLLLGLAGAVILGRGLYQFYRAFNSNSKGCSLLRSGKDQGHPGGILFYPGFRLWLPPSGAGGAGSSGIRDLYVHGGEVQGV